MITAESKYLVWTEKREENACILDFMTGFDNSFLFSKGVRLLEIYPDGVEFPMHPNYPRNLIMTDNLENLNGVIVASGRLAQFLKASDPERVELLSVTIVNHKGKKTRGEYFIINILENVDCLDTERCGASWYRVDPEEIREVECLPINEEAIGPDRTIFRCKYYSRLILIRRDLAKAIDKEGFTGVRWVEPNDYPEI